MNKCSRFRFTVVDCKLLTQINEQLCDVISVIFEIAPFVESCDIVPVRKF